MLTSEQIRKLWDEFWISKNHKEVKPCSLIPNSQDKTVLFNTAGMQQLVPYLSGKIHPDGKRLHNIQRCIRTEDIEEIWDNTHCTFFEMMWNWSLGDYFKKEALTWSFEFLTTKLDIPLDRLWATIFGWYKDWDLEIPLDLEAKEILLWIGIPENRIQQVPMTKGKKCDNFRWPAGAIWPCWPCCEIYYDKWDEFGIQDYNFIDNKRYVEIWNNVFMDMYKDEKWEYSFLSQKNVDTGMWFERLITTMQSKKSLYETDLFEPILKTIEDVIGVRYYFFDKSWKQENIKSFRIIAEHIRTVCFAIWDGVIPSNEGRWYVVRRLIRRAWYHFGKLINQNLDLKFSEIQKIKIIVESIIQKYWEFYNFLNTEKANILNFLEKEISQFDETLKNGKKLLEQEIEKIKKNWSDELSSQIWFFLYDTHGLPIDIISEFCEENGISFDAEDFQKKMSEAKEKTKKWSAKMFDKKIDWANFLNWIPQTKFLGYENTEISDFKILKDFQIENQRIIILDQTPFYAESGWQIWDSWEIIMENGEVIKIDDVKKYEWVFLHFVS